MRGIIEIKFFKFSQGSFCGRHSSLQRNWFRLIAKSKPGFQDFKCIHAIRVFVLVALTFAHSFWSMIAIPFSNPIFVEKVISWK